MRPELRLLGWINQVPIQLTVLHPGLEKGNAAKSSTHFARSSVQGRAFRKLKKLPVGRLLRFFQGFQEGQSSIQKIRLQEICMVTLVSIVQGNWP